MFETTAGVTPFAVNVFTSDNGGHSPEQVAELCVNRIIQIADTAPPELAQQALAFRQQLLAVVLQYVRMAAAEDRVTVCTKLEQSGMADLAKHVRSL
jgi:hypothetical protein